MHRRERQKPHENDASS